MRTHQFLCDERIKMTYVLGKLPEEICISLPEMIKEVAIQPKIDQKVAKTADKKLVEVVVPTSKKVPITAFSKKKMEEVCFGEVF